MRIPDELCRGICQSLPKNSQQQFRAVDTKNYKTVEDINRNEFEKLLESIKASAAESGSDNDSFYRKVNSFLRTCALYQQVNKYQEKHIPLNLTELLGNRDNFIHYGLCNFDLLLSYIKARDTLVIFEKVAQMLEIAPMAFERTKSIEQMVSRVSQCSKWVQDNAKSIEKLEKLDLSKLGLCHIPIEIKYLKGLKKLNLEENLLKSMPAITELKELSYLNITDNQFYEVPETHDEVYIDLAYNCFDLGTESEDLNSLIKRYLGLEYKKVE